MNKMLGINTNSNTTTTKPSTKTTKQCLKLKYSKNNENMLTYI